MVDLPQDFKTRMKRQLGSSYEKFLAGYEKERVYGLRYNPLKIDRDRLVSIFRKQQTVLEPVPWAEEGFYYPPGVQPGRQPLHEAGAYYIQEPSAMAVVGLLDPGPGDRVLDLCAAPGGKSTQIAGRMRGEGLLVSNEIIPARAKTLSRNIERMGAANTVVLNETPERLAEHFPEFFHRVIVDAPCSGEGMFRKDAQACTEWSLEQVERCAARQKDILSWAVKMVKPGGILVYSTCTFAPRENEETAEWLAQKYPQFVLDESVQLWPHLHRGEGHYGARFCCHKPSGQKAPGQKESLHKLPKTARPPKDANCSALLQEFLQETLTEEAAAHIARRISGGCLAAFGENLYLLPSGIRSLDGLKAVRAGLQLGCCRKNRFEPSHALAMALRPAQARQTFELPEPEKYLRGETIDCGSQTGWTLVTIEGCSIGWGKAARGILKNHYPKGLRRIY